MKPILDKRVFGPWAIVTGASSGIGKEIAKRISADGISVVLVARRLHLLDALGTSLARDFGVSYRAVECDLSVPGFFESIEKATRDLDIGLYVGNAGSANPGELWTLERDDLLAALHLKVIANLTLSHHFASRLVARGRGGILLTSSVGGLNGVPYVSHTAGLEAYLLAPAPTAGLWRRRRRSLSLGRTPGMPSPGSAPPALRLCA